MSFHNKRKLDTSQDAELHLRSRFTTPSFPLIPLRRLSRGPKQQPNTDTPKPQSHASWRATKPRTAVQRSQTTGNHSNRRSRPNSFETNDGPSTILLNHINFTNSQSCLTIRPFLTAALSSARICSKARSSSAQVVSRRAPTAPKRTVHANRPKWNMLQDHRSDDAPWCGRDHCRQRVSLGKPAE